VLGDHPKHQITSGMALRPSLDERSVAAVRIILRLCHKFSPDRIEMYISAQLKQVTVPLDYNGLVSALKEMATAMPFSIHIACV